MPSGNDELDRLHSFFAMERRHDLFSARVDGWSPWRVMRGPVLLSTLALPLAAVGRPTLVRSFEAAAATLKLTWLLLFGQKRSLLVKSCRSALRMQSGEKFRDIYFDGLLQRGHSFLKLEEINSPDFDRQAASALFPPQLDPVAFTFWGRLLGHIMPVRAAAPFCRSLSGILRRELGVDLDPSWLLMRVSTVHWQGRLYGLLLRRIRPRAVLVSDTGEFGIRLACVRRGTPFIELQHGVFDFNHPDAIPADVPGSVEELLLPDILASRAQFWIDQLADTRQGRAAIVAVGSELIDEARAVRAARPSGGPVHLVLTSQGYDTANLAAWIGEAIRAAPAALDWRLSIKLHPIYDENTTDFDGLELDPRIEIVPGAASPNVFDLLARADLHLSISSACHFDAAALGVRSVVIPLPSHKLLRYAVDEDAICLARRPADIWPLLAAVRPDPRKEAWFSAPGFLDIMEKIIADPRSFQRPSVTGTSAGPVVAKP